jgi:hypothetical protein
MFECSKLETEACLRSSEFISGKKNVILCLSLSLTQKIKTGLWTGRELRFDSRQGLEISSQRPYRIWSSFSFLSSGYRVSFPRGKAAGA